MQLVLSIAHARIGAYIFIYGNVFVYAQLAIAIMCTYTHMPAQMAAKIIMLFSLIRYVSNGGVQNMLIPIVAKMNKL